MAFLDRPADDFPVLLALTEVGQAAIKKARDET